MMLEIRWHGRGGQGAITASRALAMAALKNDLYVQSFPEYGPERGGAPLKAYNRISDSEIKLHCGIEQPDLVAVIDETLLEAEDVIEGLKDKGALIINTTRSPQEIAEETGYRGKVITVDAERIAQETNRYANVPTLGALMRAIESLPLQDVESSLKELLSGKLSDKTIELNVEALRRGHEEALEGRGVKKRRRTPKAKGLNDLKSYREIPIGGVITPKIRRENETGGWRQKKPVFEEALCVNCLLCWINCPEPAIVVEEQKMKGYDYRYCKGCGICKESCPVEAISMVAESDPVPPLGRIPAQGVSHHED